jgi:hypothetical protein
LINFNTLPIDVKNKFIDLKIYITEASKNIDNTIKESLNK